MSRLSPRLYGNDVTLESLRIANTADRRRGTHVGRKATNKAAIEHAEIRNHIIDPNALDYSFDEYRRPRARQDDMIVSRHTVKHGAVTAHGFSSRRAAENAFATHINRAR